MARKPRQFDIGNVYHIINRGVDGRKIFSTNQDYSRFILGLEFFNDKELIDLWSLIFAKEVTKEGQTLLSEKLENQRKNKSEPIVEIMAFALMPNHYHLILREITLGGISLFLQKMGGYVTYFNKQYNRTGALFQSRYKCVEIKTDAQLFVVFNYVHTNPVELIEPMWKNQQVESFDKAKNFLENYKWSSYRDYIGVSTFSNVTSRNFFLKLFRHEKNCQKEIEDWIRFKAINYLQKDQLIPNIKDFE